MHARLRRLARAQGGASPVEYGLLAAAIVIVVVLVAFAFGSYLRNALDTPCVEGADTASTPAACTVEQAR